MVVVVVLWWWIHGVHVCVWDDVFCVLLKILQKSVPKNQCALRRFSLSRIPRPSDSGRAQCGSLQGRAVEDRAVAGRSDLLQLCIGGLVDEQSVGPWIPVNGILWIK